MRALALALLACLLAGCSLGGRPPSRAARSPSPPSSPSPTATATPDTSPAPLRVPGALRFKVDSLAQGLEAPWALDFAPDGAIWLTERPGRVRVVRDGRLLPQPALTLSVASRPGCENGLLGLVVKPPYAYAVYTHGGAGGLVNRVSRFTIQGDQLGGEQVLLDGIPGGTCYHFGGRLKLGPDGFLYLTTGEGFVASRAASRGGLSGKILRLSPAGGAAEVFAWGFRNPEGLAFDAAGRLYSSNNGPTGDLGLCCHDRIDLVRQGAFYGWPAWAANVRTSYPAAGLPPQTPPIVESGTDTWAPSGMAFYTAHPGELPVLLVAELRGQALRRLLVDPGDPTRVTSQDVVLRGYGRLRDVVAGPDGCAYVLTTNRDGRGATHAGDDQLLRLCPS